MQSSGASSAFNRGLLSVEGLCELLLLDMHLIADTVDVHAFERVLQILRESVDGGLIFALLPSLELSLLVDALDVRDEVARIALVDDAVARGGADRVHVASLPVRVDIAESLPGSNDADLDFFD